MAKRSRSVSKPQEDSALATRLSEDTISRLAKTFQRTDREIEDLHIAAITKRLSSPLLRQL